MEMLSIFLFFRNIVFFNYGVIEEYGFGVLIFCDSIVI